MGNNLSSTVEPDLSGVVLADYDRASNIRLAVIFAISFYGMAMIWAALALIDRWRGPYDKIRTTKGSLVAAMVLSTAWPVVLAYIMMADTR